MALVAFLHRLHPLAPNLTHLRLSKLLVFNYDMARALHSELAERGAVPAQFPRLRERQWNAQPRAVPADWDRFSRRPESSIVWLCNPRSSRLRLNSCAGVVRGFTLCTT